MDSKKSNAIGSIVAIKFYTLLKSINQFSFLLFVKPFIQSIKFYFYGNHSSTAYTYTPSDRNFFFKILIFLSIRQSSPMLFFITLNLILNIFASLTTYQTPLP
jgi:hypothetical protein